jgi:hypothetical protein
VYLDFPSHSAARKTLEGFKYFDHFTVEWVSVTGQVMGDADFTKAKTPFKSRLFLEDPLHNFLVTPIDPGPETCSDSEVGEYEGEELLGSNLFEIINEVNRLAAATVSVPCPSL